MERINLNNKRDHVIVNNKRIRVDWGGDTGYNLNLIGEHIENVFDIKGLDELNYLNY